MRCNEITLSSADFEYVRTIARDKAAIVIDPDKRYLVESRLGRVAEDEGFDSLTALIHALRKSDQSGTLHSRAIEALATHETFFFRDRHPFDALRDSILPELIAARRDRRRLNIWSAAASTGQEAYSLAMLIRDHFPELESWDICITGTDISETVLKQARSGSYAYHEVSRGLPPALLMRHFTQIEDAWVIKPALRKMVTFRGMNLIGTWPALPVCDVILIRNVLIYFDTGAKRSILERIARQLAPDGYMGMGSAETPMLVTGLFTPVSVGSATFYRKNSLR